MHNKGVCGVIIVVFIKFDQIQKEIIILKNIILNREIIHTLDGSTTIQIKEWDECYHSKHGAIQEAQHVFIKNGLSLFQNKQISILKLVLVQAECIYYFFEGKK
jgi:4-hydroxy-3-methylbut-2-enyl diphosphate reductase IspH